MKKAILFEPELLAEVERESPAVYENYCQTPFSTIEFADYGTAKHPMTQVAHMDFNFDEPSQMGAFVKQLKEKNRYYHLKVNIN